MRCRGWCAGGVRDIGEGGSGGAIGMAWGDACDLVHAFYSVISREGCAAILWKSGEQAKLAAESLRLTSRELKKLNIIDDIIPEPLGGAHRNPQGAAESLEKWLVASLRELKRTRIDTLLKRRYNRLRNVGSFFQSDPRALSRERRGRDGPNRPKVLAAHGKPSFRKARAAPRRHSDAAASVLSAPTDTGAPAGLCGVSGPFGRLPLACLGLPNESGRRPRGSQRTPRVALPAGKGLFMRIGL